MTPPFAVRLSHAASGCLRRLTPTARARVATRLAEIATQPFDLRHSKPLRGGTGDRSARVGGLRIVFTVEAEARGSMPFPARDRGAVAHACARLVEDPSPVDLKKLTGRENLWRLRVGRWSEPGPADGKLGPG